MRIPTTNLTESQWQDLRSTLTDKGMVGGSDSGTLLGLNKYKSPINLFYQSVGINNLPNKMNGAMLHGKQLEDYVAKCWQYFDGTEDGWVENTLADNKIKKYRKERAIIINPKYPFMFANIDGKITQHPDYGKKAGVLEIKTMSGFASDMYEGGINPSYLIQLQHYMIVTGWKWGEIAYLKDGRELGCISFEEDKELQDRIIHEAREFNNRVMNAKKLISQHPNATVDEMIDMATTYEPDADDSKAFNDFISDKHKRRETEVVIHGGDDLQKVVNEYQNVSRVIKILEAEKMLYQNQLKQSMVKQNATVLILPEGKITWRKQFTYAKTK